MTDNRGKHAPMNWCATHGLLSPGKTCPKCEAVPACVSCVKLRALLIAQAAQVETLKNENDDLRSRVAPLSAGVERQELPQSGNGEQSSLPSGSERRKCAACGAPVLREGEKHALMLPPRERAPFYYEED